MANMTLINKVTVGAGGAASIDFTSIPQTYTDLRIVLSTRFTSTGGANDTIWLNSINGNTSSFTDRVLRGDGSSASSFVPSETPLYIGQSPTASGTANTFASHSVYIANYTSSNQKSISVDSVQENNQTTAYMGFTAGVWTQTSAITSLSFTTNSGNFAEYSTAYLYGVESAAIGAKATGGLITQDDTYFYHTFLSSGTFTPTQSLTANYLVVAGGGSGGGQNNGGGGGAGGLRCTVGATGGGGSLESALSLTAQAYTVTIGAGGAATTGSTGNNGSNSVFSTITATGGGGGGGQSTNGASGGSGGGGAYAGTGGGSGTANQGYAGGAGFNGGPVFGGGGGGGAGAIGVAGTSSSGGNGGNGVTTSISGSSITYAGGGGGGGGGGAPGSGGTGGGGTGATASAIAATAGTANTGSGGGGCQTTSTTGAAGGSGIVIVRYAK